MASRTHGGKLVKPAINISFHVLPFNHVRIEIKGAEFCEKEIQKPKPIIYREPLTTINEGTEIDYEEGGRFSVPKTTAGN